jgi:hypothetical protein
MLARTDNTAEVGMHVFERRGLGKAPFAVVGSYTSVFQATPDAPKQPGTCCDYCGTGIMYVVSIRSRDNRTFKVGSDCVAKTGDAGLIKAYKNRPEVRARARDAATAKDAAVRAEWTALMADPANVAKLSAIMVPGRPWIPGEQVTLYDDLKRVWSMCGMAGHKRMLKSLKSRLAA